MLGQLRSGRASVLVLGVVVFLALFVGLAYNHLEPWQQPAADTTDTDLPIPQSDKAHEDNTPAKEPVPAPPIAVIDSSSEESLMNYYTSHLQKPSITVDSPVYSLMGAFEWPLRGKPYWTKPLGERLCIIDLDSRPFNVSGQIFSDGMSWQNAKAVHGLSTGILNHWVYAKIHGYKYYYVNIESYEDRRDSWKKPPIMSKILKNHDACIYLDSDAIFHRLDLPFEWLMNYWQINPKNNSLALAADPNAKGNEDKYGKVYLNTGFIVAQNNEKTYEIFDEWEACADDGGTHPECTEFRLNRPGKPTDQGGFGAYIRYDYPKDIKELSCNEANGFVESHSGCEGLFIKHVWTGKNNHLKIAVGEQLPGAYLEIFHKKFLQEKNSFYINEADLMAS